MALLMDQLVNAELLNHQRREDLNQMAKTLSQLTDLIRVPLWGLSVGFWVPISVPEAIITDLKNVINN